MLTESGCTLYLRNGEGFDRYVVPACHWQESAAASVNKSGMQDGGGIVVYIPKTAMVLFPDGRLYPSSKLFPSPSQELTTVINDVTRRGYLKNITCANGMLYNIPDNNMNTAVQYQMQITADYTIESEEL